MDIARQILDSPEREGNYFLVIKDGDRLGVIPLALEGHETAPEATERFLDALVVAKNEMSTANGYRSVGLGIDGRPREEHEVASANLIGFVLAQPKSKVPEALRDAVERTRGAAKAAITARAVRGAALLGRLGA